MKRGKDVISDKTARQDWTKTETWETGAKQKAHVVIVSYNRRLDVHNVCLSSVDGVLYPTNSYNHIFLIRPKYSSLCLTLTKELLMHSGVSWICFLIMECTDWFCSLGIENVLTSWQNVQVQKNCSFIDCDSAQHGCNIVLIVMCSWWTVALQSANSGTSSAHHPSAHPTVRCLNGSKWKCFDRSISDVSFYWKLWPVLLQSGSLDVVLGWLMDTGCSSSYSYPKLVFVGRVFVIYSWATDIE